MLFHCLNTYIFSPIDDELWLNTRSLYSYNSDIKWDLECFSWSPSTLSKKIESRESFTGGKQRLESDMIMNSCFTESRNYVVLKLKSACAWTLWPSCLLNLGSHSCSALSWWQPRIAELVFYNWHDFQGCQHQLKNHLSRSPFSHHQDAVWRVFYFNFLLQVKQKSSHGWLQPFSRATRGINQEGEEGRKQLHNCHLRFLSLGSHDLFSLTSAHLPALWPVYFYCQVSLFLSDAVSVSISSMMYYKQAVSSLIHTHTHASRLSLHFAILLHSSQNLIKGAPFIPVSENELVGHRATGAGGHTLAEEKPHEHTLILKLDCFFLVSLI